MKGLTLCGGLGDAFIVLHESTGYEDLERLGPDERARVYVISHNPFVPEVFRWHPRAAQIDVFPARHFFLDYADPAERARAGIPPEPIDPNPGRPRGPVRFWPSPEDRETIEKELPRGPFLAVAPTSSGVEIEDRNIPARVLEAALAEARRQSIPFVLLGRTYQGPHAPKAAPARPSGPGVVDLTDRLSVPGTAEAVKRCGAILTAHSALLILAWYERKPNFAVVPPEYERRDFAAPSPFGFGKGYPESTRSLPEAFPPDLFGGFLDTYCKE